MKRLVIGILAHVDAGKTTLSEAMLYQTGALRKLGRVDHGDAFLDIDAQERARGITIFSKQAQFQWNNLNVTLLDTPGHVDFSPEMERTLQVLDYAILVISGSDGVQSHTETLWRLLEHHHIPTFLFINKMDLAGTDSEKLMEELVKRLSSQCVDLTEDMPASVEQLAMCSEPLMEAYLESGALSKDDIAAAVRHRQAFPCCFGSALKLDGVDRFLSLLEEFTVMPDYPAEFGARVFKISRDDQGNRLTYLKVTGGSVAVRAVLNGTSKDGTPFEEKINGLRAYSGAKYTQIQTAQPGTICAAVGLTKTFSGMGLGYEETDSNALLQPVMTYRVLLPDDCDVHTALTRLRSLEDEEPMLHVTWNESLQELHVNLMGQVQLEILKQILLDRFQMEVEFDHGSILYQETIQDPVEGVGHFEPLRHYAEVHLLMEPTARGNGLTFTSECSEDELDLNWQRLILTHLQEKVHIGVLTGAPITDMKITLKAGKAHLKHTEGGDFRQATYRAVRQGLMQAKSILLEPWYRYRLEVPVESVGRAMHDLQRMHGSFSQDAVHGALAVLHGEAPVVEMQNYPLEVTGYTHGRGHLLCTFLGYFPCHNQEEIVAQEEYDPTADVENTPDSVFCSHGSSVIIKWDEVPAHMHLPSCLKPIPEERTWEQRAREYCAQVATDKELMAIFERTYGPIRRKPQEAMRRSPQDSTAIKRRPSMAPTGPEYLLVDGYNIIFAWEDLKQLAMENLDTARTQLIQMLVNYQGIRQCNLILVFDAYKVKGGRGSVEQVGGINVVYTKEAETADMYIERVTHEIGSGKRVRVATSDGLVQMIILGHGALRVPARIFRQEVDEAIQTIRSFLENQES